jgi:predicted TIM-barrel fold metal-dependent hydrolase
MSEVVDFHVHLTPPGMLDDFACHDDEPYWQLLTTPNPRHAAQILRTGEQMVQQMDRDGVARVVVQAGYLQGARSIAAKNAAVLDLARRFAGRIELFAAIDPRSPTAVADVDAALDAGAVGIGEVNPYAHGLRLDDPRFLAVAARCEEHGVPMSVHMSEEAGNYYLGKSTHRLNDYFEFAKRFPGLPIVFAHWGGGLFFYEVMPSVAAVLRHVAYDTAASPLQYPTERIVRVALDILPPSKILYGSDYPLRLYRGHHDVDFARFLGDLSAAVPDEAARAAIVGGNAAALLSRDRRTVTPTPASTVSDATQPIAERLELPIEPFMSVAEVARRYPRTKAVFERFGIPHTDVTVPVWEPIVQAAAARGLGTIAQAELIDALNDALG